MIRPLCLLLLLCLASSCESPPPAPPPPPTYATAPIDGTWSALAGDLGGQEFSEEVRKSIRLFIHEGRYEVTESGHFDQAIVVIDPMLKPSTMDITWMTGPNKGKRILAIYETTGDTLRICYDLSGTFRPGAFVTARGTQLLLMLYAREQ
jgi:uncharacterized protein (TIGR03067 family)